MTRQQFLDNFYLKYNAMAAVGSPGYEPLEIQTLATIAQEQLIIKSYNPKSNRLTEGFEETQKRIDDLGSLVRPQIFSTFTASTFYKNGWEVILPNTLITNGPTDFSDVYWFTIFEELESNILDCTILNNTTIYNRPEVVETSHGALKITLQNPFRKPTPDRTLRLTIEGRKHVLITDGTYNPQRYFITYIKKPQPVDLINSLNSQVSELSDHKQRELLEETIKMALKDTQSERQLRQLQVETQDPKE